MSLTATAAKFTAFVAVSVLSAVLVVNTLNHPLDGGTRTYRAEFTDAQGVKQGSEVRIAGVRVGAVEDVRLRDGTAVVSFAVLDDQPLPGGTRAVVRYADLLGSRFIALDAGDGGGTLPAGATIPLERTRPALELTALMNGFKPLFDSLDPQEANRLAHELIAVFQGESGTLTSLLERVVSVTSGLTERDQVIGEVLVNLNAVLATTSEHREEVRLLIGGLGELTSAVAEDRGRIAEALDAGGTLANSVRGSMDQITPNLTRDVDALGAMSQGWVDNQQRFDTAVQGLPELVAKLNRTLDYGSWVNIYVCNLRVSVGGAQVDLGGGPHSEVCR
ncbi:MCE family protein [Saccharopolyspora sp. NFXS83]|uniref:MCE family protein n=1 Tax=Saccharopolyspora sp. NFXS83 TaxID=2993560 RepID=UPI00224B2F83|nr:MCE family protein [Saccharopolyspora sp. NFXS83]MCX2730486.1 MCE family protein [Saccharopolyspora sp. NFXS83]